LGTCGQKWEDSFSKSFTVPIATEVQKALGPGQINHQAHLNANDANSGVRNEGTASIGTQYQVRFQYILTEENIVSNGIASRRWVSI